MSLTVQSLHIYPVKSLAGIDLSSSLISSKGFRFDRKMMLVNSANRHLTQRDFPEMALLNVCLNGEDWTVEHRLTGEQIKISFPSYFVEGLYTVRIWKDEVLAQKANAEINEWFSDLLMERVSLVAMPDEIERQVGNHVDSLVGFADSSQFLIIGQGSLDHLNSKLAEPIFTNRFRPNIVFSGFEPHIEDHWKRIRIGSQEFEVTKQCARCNLTQINQETAEVGEEPIRTLSTYRLIDRNILFGVYLKSVGASSGKVSVGDSITVIS